MPTRPTSAPRKRPAQAATTRRPAATSNIAGAHAAPRVLRNSGLDAHRAIAAAALVLMLLLSLLPPPGVSAPDPSLFVTPTMGGQNSIPGAPVDDPAAAVFPYLSVIERNQDNISSTWPDAAEVLSYDPDSLRVRRALVGQVFASTTGSLDVKVRDTGLESNPPADKLEALSTGYSKYGGERDGRAVNGEASLYLIGSLTKAEPQRSEAVNNAVDNFREAISRDPGTWQYTYNWSLANILAGNYAAAYEGMKSIAAATSEANNPLTPFWRGVAALRVGDPGEAVVQFTNGVNTTTPSGGNEAFGRIFSQARELSREGLADAQWANRQPETAYNSYFDILSLGSPSGGLYSKWLRLALDQRAYERLAADLANLEVSTSMGRESRIHHDRARLLSFLGRTGEAETEYTQALVISPDDPGLIISYGEALEASGAHERALGRAEEAIRKLGKDPSSADLAAVATAAITTTTSLAERDTLQRLLDANLLRARARGSAGNTAAVDTLALGIAQSASSLPAAEAGLVNLYAGMAYEAGGVWDKAATSYAAAWDKLKALAPGSAGRAAALAGTARALARSKDAAAGIAALKAGGYDPADLKPGIATDPDAATILHQAGLIYSGAGQVREAAGSLRVAAVLGGLRGAQPIGGAQRPLWGATGTAASSANLALAAAGQATGTEQAARLYKQAIGANPALAAAWNNLGVLYANSGSERARFYLEASGAVSPRYVFGQHNSASYLYQSGIANFFSAERAEGAAIKAGGPRSLLGGYSVRADNRGPLPAPAGQTYDFLGKLPAFVIVGLLLAQTLIGRDRQTNRMGLIPAKGVLGRVATLVDARVREAAPRLVAAKSGSRGLLTALAVPSITGAIALAWHAGQGSLGVALVYLPVALLAAVIALGANEVAQHFAARRAGASTIHHLWPFGALLGVVGIPFGFLYGWQVTTRLQGGATAEAALDGGSSTDPAAKVRPDSRARTSQEIELAREAELEAVADDSAPDSKAAVAPPRGVRGRLGLSPAAGIFFAGLAANLALALLFGAVYLLTGWPSMRLAMFASALVLAFTSVSEPPADGWTVYRRNAPLWLALFSVGALLAVLLASGLL